ncbi:hypothetical protein EC973_000862 [Apophysomyces ossiformis]|uniref:UDP-glucose:glycoprotein glucosyltransferase n=1 Tax=Apophysomyces ossiformis TaxID=679940 RepID=A0A8H7BQT1_9FUNG|nr:hypothetical protein EC973_000862 [Apophysomyces ossiformis]
MTRTKTFVLGIAALGTCLLHTVLANTTPSPPVDLTLVAPWPASDLLVEIAEVAAAENDISYFELIDDLVAISRGSPKQMYQDALNALTHKGHIATQRNMDILKLGMALHIAAPRIEAYHQLYNQTVIPIIDSYDPDCSVWAQLDQVQICDVTQLEERIKALATSEDGLSLLPFDHILRPKGMNAGKTVILYTNAFSTLFATFHSNLKSFVTKYGINYVLRYKPSSDLNDLKPLYLSGYGVELALKNTDYLVIDDRAAEEQHGTSKHKVSNAGQKLGQTLFENVSPAIEPLTPTEIKDLGLKAAQLIAVSSDPFTVLSQLSQDFPKYAKSLSEVELEEPFEEEIKRNQMSVVQSGMNAIWFNGLLVESEQMDPFHLLRILQREGRLVDSLENIGLSKRQAIDLLTHPALSENEAGASAIDDVYDVRDPSDNTMTIWWNDLEKDKRYKGWSNNLFDASISLLRPVYPGQLRAIKRNIYNLLMIENLTSASSLLRIQEDVQAMVKGGTPIRFGIIPIVGPHHSAETIAAKILHHLVAEHGKSYGMNFLAKIHEQLQDSGLHHASEAMVKNAFEALVAAEDKLSSDLDSILSSEVAYESNVRDFLKRMGIFREDEGIMFLNGKLLESSNEKPWKHVLMNALQEQNQIIARDLYFGKLSPHGDIYEHLLSQPYVARSRNPYITVSENRPLRMLTVHEHHAELDNLKYLSNAVEGGIEPDTNLWVVTDFDSAGGIKLALEALAFTHGNDKVRLSFIHNPIDKFSDHSSARFSDLLYMEIYEKTTVTLSRIEELLLAALETESEQTGFVEQVKPLVPGSPIIETAGIRGKEWQQFTGDLLMDGLDGSFHGLVINGRIIGPLPLNLDFTKENFDSLYQYEAEMRLGPLRRALEETSVVVENGLLSDMIMQSMSILESDKASMPKTMFDSESKARLRSYKSMTSNQTKITFGDRDNAFLEVGVILDPLSETAQKWSVLLEKVLTIDGVFIEIYLNPHTHLEEIPLKRFYRYVVDPELHFDAVTGALQAPAAYFADLPTDALYTLGVDTVKSWHVAVKEANMDLDNVKLTMLDEHSSVSAVYELEHILIEGHCMDSTTQGAPRGLQFVLGTESNSAITDTIVMANLGYFQLRASPGVWNLALREGRSNQIYHIENIGTAGKWEKGNQKTALALTSFEGLTIFPQVKKNPGMENEDVLLGEKQNSDQEGFWSSLTNKWFGNNEKQAVTHNAPKQADINIFSVASGQLYERFMSIMIASVMEHTKSTVKFWFIENFLSPSFKNFVPEMAKEYGFDYEMVTYKWPSWLRAQKEKQRTIWGYKVLFLDVLFPLDLEKVIFVDADQIVRADMKELVDMDLHGAPYGYTPFCSDRTEMDGFRFWTQGYWKDHLQDKPYHISALYVVDLVRFRELAAGDRLRAQYQQLSADPNSLANLDQDLPNNMQHIVPIYSLPQEWLWCETWCSDESLKKAKTIDLCNNPMTKEPKLDRARRQVPEWEKYDEQIHQLRKKVAAGASSPAADTQQNAPKTKQGHRFVDEL